MLVLQYRRKDLDSSVSTPQSGKMEICGAASSTRRTQTISFISEVKSNVAPIFEEGRDRVDAAGYDGQAFAVITMTVKNTASCLMFEGMGMCVRAANLSSLRQTPFC